VAWISENDALSRKIVSGDVVRLHNERGECRCRAVVTRDIRPGVVKLSTGSRGRLHHGGDPLGFDAEGGNPNMLTLDQGTSRLAQGPSAQTCLVELDPISR
jgi:biotin/methionine sulfoxide reductase